jgi:tRNA (adenine22-N1)-methyltransferase
MTRFDDIVSLVPQGVRSVADVGYDHGRVILLLAKTHQHVRIIGVEQQAEARGRFWRRRGADESLRSRVELLHGDGLEPLANEPPDVVVIGGLGERSIVEILTGSEGILSRIRRLVLAPMDTQGLLRRYLRSVSWSAVAERLSRRKGRFYQVYAAEPGVRGIDEATWLFGTDLFRQHHPLLLEFLTDLRRRYRPLVEYYKDDRDRIPSFYRSINTAIAVARDMKAKSPPG